MIALIGQKGNMAQLYDERGVVVPATEVRVGECVVVDKRTQERNGYEALQIGFGAVSKRKSSKPLLGSYKKAGVPPARSLQEIKVDKIADYKVGQKLGVGVFALGDTVHVTGVTRGRGFAGGLTRWGWLGGPSSPGDRRLNPARYHAWLNDSQESRLGRFGHESGAPAEGADARGPLWRGTGHHPEPVNRQARAGEGRTLRGRRDTGSSRQSGFDTEEVVARGLADHHRRGQGTG